VIQDLLTFPVTVVEGAGTYDAPWKSSVIEFQRRWIAFSGYPELSAAPEITAFSTINHIPDQAPRHERWRTEYRRNPYMKSLTKEQLRDIFDEIMLVSTLGFLKDPPVRIERDKTAEAMERFTHMMLEMADRAIPATGFPHSPARDVAASRRLGLPASVEEWIWKLAAYETPNR
jgi:hypothetical protein